MSCFLVPPADVTIVQVPCNCECDVSSSCLKMASFAFHLWWDSAWQTPVTSSCMFVCLLVLMHNLSQLSHYPSLGREVRIYQLLSHQLESFFSLLVFLSCPHSGDPQQPSSCMSWPIISPWSYWDCGPADTCRPGICPFCSPCCMCKRCEEWRD